ncbi:MAG: cell division protein FtsZ [Bacteroidetes bacterium]|nr:MAG: cell division protein FtsZ [Bacteroidota bacterium]TAG89352.1 MAG: cell division protein FtsZ [Bacteroidota bacterium]
MEQQKFATPSIIKVIGVGGGGSNAVRYMYNKGIKDVDFIVCNTDVQALNMSDVPTRLQIGAGLTEGLGAGANPEVGREAALESREEIKELFSHNTKMLFITAGMGGGTGTGAAPVIAQIARELGILTVAIVTSPFGFEGRKKRTHAEDGLNALRDMCDTVLVISNDKLKEVYGNLKMSEAFSQADNILATAAKGIAEMITVEQNVNVDFEDVKTVMKNSGAAVMGSAKAEGEGRALRGAQEALSSPLLNNQNVFGAQKILLSIMSGKSELGMDELGEITDYITEQTGTEATIIFGLGTDLSLGDAIRVTIIATGFKDDIFNREEKEKTPIKAVENTPKPVENTPKTLPEESRVVTFNVPPQIETIPEVRKEASKIVYDLDEESDVKNSIENTPKNPIGYDYSRSQFITKADELIEKLKAFNKSELSNEVSPKEMEIPAYLRRNQFKMPHNNNNNENM